MADDEATARAARAARPVAIYVLVDPRDGRVFYVGKTISPTSQRLRAHICDARAGRMCGSGPPIREIITDGGRPGLMVLETVEASEWQAAERWWIAHYRMLGPLGNITDGGDAICVAALSPEMIRKAADARRKSPKWAAGIKRAAEKNRGRKHSVETKEKMSATAKGRRPSDATVAATGARYRGKKLAPDHAAKCANGRRGKSNSSEHRAKQRQAMEKHQTKQSSDQAARWRDPEYRARMLASMAGRKLTDTQKERLAETTKLAWRDPQSRQKRLASLLVASKNPEVRAKNSAAVKAKWADPAWRARRKAAEAKRKRHYLQMEA